jgi:hypothetical protein
MANQTLAANQNYDDAAISGLANGEGITLAGFNLLCDSDSRWGQQAAVHGNITPSATLGGDVLWDSTRVWWMAYDAPSGTVPALGTCGVQNSTGGTSGATGEFLGIWSSIPGAPVAAASAIPSTGWIKFRSKVGTFQDNETVTLSNGATLTVNSSTGGQRGWLHWVGQAGGSCNTVRLGTAKATGDWFELGVTDGTDDQTFAIPVLDHVPFIEIETGVGTGVYEKWVNPGFRWGQSVQMVATDIRGKCFGQWKEVTATSTNASPTVTMSDTTGFLVGMPIGYPSDGTVHVADGAVIVSIIANTSITLSKNATVAGSFTFRSPLGTITLARRATNACGYKPDSGLRVRCPNAWMSTADSASWSGNQNWYTSTSSRWEITAAGGGIVTFDKVNCLWYHNTPGAYQWVMTNCGVSGGAALNVGNVTLPLIFNDNAGGGDCPQSFTVLNANNLPNGSSIQRNWLVRINNRSIADRVVTSADAVGMTFNGNHLMQFGGEGTQDRSFGDNRMIEVSRWVDSSLDNNTFIGGLVLINTMLRCTVNNHVFADRMNGATTATNGINAIILQTQCVDCMVSNLSLIPGLTNVHPFSSGIVIQTGCLRCKVREIGTPSALFNCGSSNQMSYTVQVTSSNDCEINRIYNTANRFAVFNTTNTVYRLTCDNLWGGGAVGYILNQIDSVCRGMYGTPAANAAQSVYGSHWTDSFPSDTTGLVRVFFNEPTAASVAQMAITAGTPAFTACGQISMPTAGDQIVAEMEYFCLGHTSLANIAPTLTGTLTTNMSYEFQYDFGSGWNGSWLTLDATNLSGAGAITPATGFKLKIRVTTVTPDPTNALTSIRIDTVTDAVSQVLTYPYKTDATIAVSVFESGSRLRIYNVTKATELLNDVVVGTAYAYNYYNGIEIAVGDVVELRVRKLGKEIITLTTVATLTGGSFLFAQLDQPQCTSTTPTDVTIDYVNKKIRATGTRAAFSTQELVDIIGAAQATVDGIRLPAFAGISGNVTLKPGVTVGLTVDLLGWQTSWASGSVAQATLDGGNTVGGIAGDPIEDVVGGPQVTNNVSAAATMNTANVPTAAQIAAAVRAELAVELARIDAATTTRLASASYVTPPTASANASAVWDEVLTGDTHNIPTSAGRRLRQVTSSIIIDGTARGSGASNNQIQLGTDASATDGAYDPSMVYIVSGTGAGQCRIILQYAGASRMATVHRSWRTLPNATSEYVIAAYGDTASVNEGLAQGGSPTTITLNVDASSVNGIYVGQLVFLVSGTGEDQCGMVTAYNGTTKVATIDMGAGGGWSVTPDTTTAYVMMPASPIIISSASACATQLDEIHRIHGLKSGEPMTVTPMTRVSGSISQTITGDGTTTSTVTRV